MSYTKRSKPTIPTYDYFKENILLFLFAGYSESRSFIYILYIAFLFVVLTVLTALATYGAYLVIPRKDIIMDAIHVQGICLFAIWGLASRIFTDRSLRQVADMINMGIFSYTEDDFEKEEIEMKKKIPVEIKRRGTVFMMVFTCGLSINVIVFPISQYFILADDDPSHDDPVVNPYLPPAYFFFIPFNSRTFLGFCLAYVFIVLLLISVYGVTTCMSEIYVTCSTTLKFHSEMLNMSIRNLPKRAFMKYAQNKIIDAQNTSVEELHGNIEFQKCLYECFRTNIQHHQALIRFKKLCQPYCGAILLDTVTIALICYAAGLYLILQELPVNYIVTHLALLMAEQNYTFYICYFGEEVLDESSKLFETLYDIPWFHCNKGFNRTLNIMMSYAQKPLSLRAMLLDVAASLETYGDLVATVYKIMSLVRHSDSIK